MKEKVRYISADLLRGLVIIIMIEVHVFNAFLIPELRQSGWFGILNFLNGLVAPSFLFVSGFAFQVSSGGKLDEMRKFGKAFWKKVMRIFQIIIIGYVLHIPIFSLTDIINKATPQQIESLLAVDVLQCIGVGLLFLFITRLIIKSDKVYNYFLIISLVVVTLISPIFWKTDFTSLLPLVIANYFNRLNGSLFPMFPWLNFLLAGAIFAKYFVGESEKNQEVKFIKYSTIVGLILLLFGHLFYSGFSPQVLTSIVPNPVFYIERMGYIFVLFSLCWIVDKKTNIKNSFIMDASRESLLVYWLHLVTIYGMFLGGKSLAIIIGQKLNGLEATMSAIILIALMIIVSKTWGLLKKNYTNYVSISVKAVVVVLIIVFIIF